MKAKTTDQRPRETLNHDDFPPGALQGRPGAWLSTAGQIQIRERMVGIGFVVGELVAAAASAVQFIIVQGQYLPEIVFRGLQCARTPRFDRACSRRVHRGPIQASAQVVDAHSGLRGNLGRLGSFQFTVVGLGSSSVPVGGDLDRRRRSSAHEKESASV